jgi:hypothetical protein
VGKHVHIDESTRCANAESRSLPEAGLCECSDLFCKPFDAEAPVATIAS